MERFTMNRFSDLTTRQRSRLLNRVRVVEDTIDRLVPDVPGEGAGWVDAALRNIRELRQELDKW